MYLLSGDEFNNLVKREFTPGLMTAESSGSLLKVFDCRSQSLRTAEFDLLRFSGTFQENTSVNNFQDTTHVSMHFQIAGRSNATISGFLRDQPMQARQFNILNCIDPISSFIFPKQQNYEYLCVGLKMSFFNDVLEECGIAQTDLLSKNTETKSFTLFDSAGMTNYNQASILKLLLNPPVADNLKGSYMKSKVKELLIISLDSYLSRNFPASHAINKGDIDKLNAVKDYLSANYLSDLTLESICRSFLLNEFKLKKGFKQLFGYTVFGYIHELRMHHAHCLLTNKESMIGEIAAVVGYTSDSSFIRAFRCFFGYSPGKVRIG